MRYIPTSATDRREMLEAIGVRSTEDLFSGIPENLRLRRPLNIPKALSEPELIDHFRSLAQRNATDFTSFLGAGVYRHHIPLIIDTLISRSEFFTAYTPYQAEIAQGTLQAIFEFQTYMCQLTGMDVANASLYDGGTGLAEAVLMANRINRRSRFLIARSVHPEYRAVVSTYARNIGLEIEFIDYEANGQVDRTRLSAHIDDRVSAVVIQSPNFFGTVESTAEVAELAHAKGALLIVGIAEAMSLGLLAPPGTATHDDRRADIVVGEAQSLGVPMSFGGPHVGFLATRSAYLRQLPGRLVGMGSDQNGKRAFVLTLSTREQHIRREKATSNICTNQSLCALMTTIYLATMGPAGLREIAGENVRNTAYAARQIQERTKHRVLFDGPRFNEFVVALDGDADTTMRRLIDGGIIPGVAISRFYPELKNSLLVSVTEVHKKADIDALVKGLA